MASTSALIWLLAAVMKVKTAERQTVRRKMSPLTLKKSLSCDQCKDALSSGIIFNWMVVCGLMRRISRTRKKRPMAKPLYCAITVPNATPLMSQWNTSTKSRLQTMFTQLRKMAIHMGSREFCMPINHPLMA